MCLFHTCISNADNLLRLVNKNRRGMPLIRTWLVKNSLKKNQMKQPCIQYKLYTFDMFISLVDRRRSKQFTDVYLNSVFIPTPSIFLWTAFHDFSRLNFCLAVRGRRGSGGGGALGSGSFPLEYPPRLTSAVDDEQPMTWVPKTRCPQRVISRLN